MTISKTGRAFYFNDRVFQRHNGVLGNFVGIETGGEYEISGVKKEKTDRPWAGSGKIIIDEKTAAEYLAKVYASSMETIRLIAETIEDRFPIGRVRDRLNEVRRARFRERESF